MPNVGNTCLMPNEGHTCPMERANAIWRVHVPNERCTCPRECAHTKRRAHMPKEEFGVSRGSLGFPRRILCFQAKVWGFHRERTHAKRRVHIPKGTGNCRTEGAHGQEIITWEKLGLPVRIWGFQWKFWGFHGERSHAENDPMCGENWGLRGPGRARMPKGEFGVSEVGEGAQAQGRICGFRGRGGHACPGENLGFPRSRRAHAMFGTCALRLACARSVGHVARRLARAGSLWKPQIFTGNPELST